MSDRNAKADEGATQGSTGDVIRGWLSLVLSLGALLVSIGATMVAKQSLDSQRRGPQPVLEVVDVHPVGSGVDSDGPGRQRAYCAFNLRIANVGGAGVDIVSLGLTLRHLDWELTYPALPMTELVTGGAYSGLSRSPNTSVFWDGELVEEEAYQRPDLRERRGSPVWRRRQIRIDAASTMGVVLELRFYVDSSPRDLSRPAVGLRMAELPFAEKPVAPVRVRATLLGADHSELGTGWMDCVDAISTP